MYFVLDNNNIVVTRFLKLLFGQVEVDRYMIILMFTYSWSKGILWFFFIKYMGFDKNICRNFRQWSCQEKISTYITAINCLTTALQYCVDLPCKCVSPRRRVHVWIQLQYYNYNQPTQFWVDHVGWSSQMNFCCRPTEFRM